MLAALQVIFFLALGLVAIEVSLFAWLNTGAWWLVAAATFLAYAGFLSGIFLGDQHAWLPRLFSATYRLAFRSMPSSIAVAAVCVGLAGGGGVYLSSIWPKAVLTVTVYTSGFPSDRREKDVDVFVRDILKDAPPTVKPTDERGHAAFAVKAGSKLEMAVRATHTGRLQYGKLGFVEITKVPFAQPIRLADIRDDAWSPAADSTPPRTPVSIVSALSGTIEQTSRSVTADGVSEKQHAPWGVPLAPLVVRRAAYTLGFDPQKKVPSWLAYRVEPPDPDFRRPAINPSLDPAIPPQDQATITDYRGSGYDRGAFISALDIASLGRDAIATAFFMSVVAPQVPHMNRVTWLKLEQYTRRVAGIAGETYVISGPAFAHGDVPARDFLAIGEHKVAVPTHYFRILARKTVNGGPDVLAFLVPNRSDADPDFKAYRVPVEAIESVTGLHFFSDVEQSQRTRLVSSTAGDLWPISGSAD